MRGWRGALSWQTAFLHAALVGVRIMFGYLALSLGADAIFLAWMASTFAIPALIGALPAGGLSDRFGGSRIALIGIALILVGTILAASVYGLNVVLIASALCGLGQMLAMVGLQTIAANVSAQGQSDGAFGTLTAAASVGQLVGPPLVTLFATQGPNDPLAPPATAVGLLVCASLLVLSAVGYFPLSAGEANRQIERAVKRTGPKMASVARIKGIWYSIGVSAAVVVTMDLLYAFIPVWAIEQGVDVATVGILLSIRALVSTVCRIGLGRLVARLGRSKLIVLSMLVGAAGLVALPLVDEFGAIASMIGVGICIGIPQPLTMASVASLVPRSAYGAALGLRLTANRLAQVSLPLAIVGITGPIGAIGIYWANAALVLGAVAVAMITPNDLSAPGKR